MGCRAYSLANLLGHEGQVMDDDLKAELQETRRMCNHRITSLKAQAILGQVIFWGAVAVAIVTWLLNIGPGVLTIIVLLAGFAITLHALLPHPQTRRLQQNS